MARENRIVKYTDDELAELVMDRDNATIEMPQPKAILNMRGDKDILDYFRQNGKGYQTRIHAVLRTYVEQQGRRQPG